MTRRILIAGWLLTLMLMTVVAGFSWVDVLLSPELGGQKLEITGYLAFPIISALVLLQGASLLASVFTPVIVSRIIAAAQIPVVSWHMFAVFSGSGVALQQAIASEVTKATGVVGVQSQGQLIELALDNSIWYVYAAILALNLVSLVALSLKGSGPAGANSSRTEEPDSDELWESQR